MGHGKRAAQPILVGYGAHYLQPSRLPHGYHDSRFSAAAFLTNLMRTVAVRVLRCVGQVPAARTNANPGIHDRSHIHRQPKWPRVGPWWALSRSRSLLVIPILTSGVLTVTACSRGARGSSTGGGRDSAAMDTDVALPVAGAIVRSEDLVLTIRTTGQVRAERLLRIEAEAQGVVAEVATRPGQPVQAGQVLVRLDPRPFDLAVREADAALAEAQGRWRDMLIGEDTTDMTADAVDRRRNARMRIGIDGAEARAERARLERDRATIKAPFGGTIDGVNVIPGQRVAVGTHLATLVDLGSLVVEAAVLEHDLPSLRRGAAAVITTAAARGRSYAGTAIAVLPLVDTATRAGRVLVRVGQRGGVLRPGMYADVDLETTRLPNRVIVPAQAVLERDGRPLVFRYRAGRAEWVYVALGRSNGRETEILADSATGRPAVTPGDTVLVGGHLTLTHDAPVQLLFSSGAQASPHGIHSR